MCGPAGVVRALSWLHAFGRSGHVIESSLCLSSTIQTFPFYGICCQDCSNTFFVGRGRYIKTLLTLALCRTLTMLRWPLLPLSHWVVTSAIMPTESCRLNAKRFILPIVKDSTLTPLGETTLATCLSVSRPELNCSRYLTGKHISGGKKLRNNGALQTKRGHRYPTTDCSSVRRTG